MAQKQSLELSLGPVIHGVGQQLHRDGVDSQEVAHKHDPLYVLVEKENTLFRSSSSPSCTIILLDSLLTW